jgi:ferritin-like metal-binding protein YciE
VLTNLLTIRCISPSGELGQWTFRTAAVVAHRVAERAEAPEQHLDATIVAVDQAVEHYEITHNGSVMLGRGASAKAKKSTDKKPTTIAQSKLNLKSG